jgi:hypothetical protein
MPRGSRIDAAGALHHIMGRGIERLKFFGDDEDRNIFLHTFLHRLEKILIETIT